MKKWYQYYSCLPPPLPPPFPEGAAPLNTNHRTLQRGAPKAACAGRRGQIPQLLPSPPWHHLPPRPLSPQPTQRLPALCFSSSFETKETPLPCWLQDGRGLLTFKRRETTTEEVQWHSNSRKVAQSHFKTTMRYYPTPNRMAKIEKKQKQTIPSPKQLELP